jgi:hypothetical protein
VDGLHGLRGETWGVLLGAFPQVVGAGDAARGRVKVELDCVAPRIEPLSND